MIEKNKIGLFGFGVVGQGFYDYLNSNDEVYRVPSINVKDQFKRRRRVKASFTTTPTPTKDYEKLDVVVELTNSEKEAFNIVSKGLSNGKNVVSANKKMIANNLAELIQLEGENKGNLLYEGAVCGSIPIIRILNDLFSNEQINEVSGIFNGSSNFILTKLFNEDISYETALKEAQENGFAESDPSSDVLGYDTLYKLIIITAHAFGKIISSEEVLTAGIDQISRDEILFAKKNGWKIKLVGKAMLVEGKLTLTVLPTLADSTSDLFNIEDEYNGVIIRSENIGKQVYSGKGAGSLPTGSVVYSDLKALDNNYKYSYKKLRKQNPPNARNTGITLLIRHKDLSLIKKWGIQIEYLCGPSSSTKHLLVKIAIGELLKYKKRILERGISLLAVDVEEY